MSYFAVTFKNGNPVVLGSCSGSDSAGWKFIPFTQNHPSRKRWPTMQSALPRWAKGALIIKAAGVQSACTEASRQASSKMTDEDLAINKSVAARMGVAFWQGLDHMGVARVAGRRDYVRNLTLARVKCHGQYQGHSHLATDLVGGEAINNAKEWDR